KEAIDYFNENAGGSKTKKPLMKGGVVIFAAGNESTRQPTYPAAEENVISVAAFNPDYAASWYTNYGETVDIAAPGGTQPVGEKYPRTEGLPTSAILSTVPRAADGKGGYAYMQGTSMACPHVSGIAALIVSKYGSSTFTSAELRNRLLTGVKAMNYNDYVDKNHFDGMGSGYIDAFAALQNYDMDAVPADPEFMADRSQSGYGSIKVAWKSGNSGANGTLHQYVLYASKRPITAANVNTDAVMAHRIAANYASANEVFERTNMRLENHTTYYFAVKAVARNGKESKLVALNTPVTTLNNTAPTIKADLEGNRITLAGKDIRTVNLTVADAEAHDWSYTLRHGSNFADQRTANGIALTIDASKYVPGIYPSEVVVTDEHGAETVFHMIVEIQSDRTPMLKKEAPQAIHVGQGAQLTLGLADLIDDEDLGSTTYELETDAKIGAALHDGRLVITGKEWGESYVEIKATDKHRQTGVFRIPVFVYQNEGIYALYPTVTTATLYVKLGDVVNGEMAMRIRNAAGKSVMQQAFNTTTIDAQKRTLLVDVSKLVPGRYTMSISNQGQTYEETFIKQ
ncbi:MAG TPA: S8 family serine peptidase, partial [Prevotella sp.]